MTNDASTRAEMSFAKRYNLFFWFRHAALLGWAIMIMFPIFWMISTSFKDSGDWVAWPPNWFPSFIGGGYEPTLHNYRQIFSIVGHGEGLSREYAEQAFTIWGAVRDSMVVSSISALIALLLGTFLAYSISRFNVGGKYFRYMILTIRMVPPIIIAIPVVMYYAILIPFATQTVLNYRFSMIDSYTGLCLLYIATTLPFVIWMMLNFIEEIPKTIEHAAQIMGAGRIYTLRRVVMPLVAPGMVVTFLFIFILNWERVPARADAHPAESHHAAHPAQQVPERDGGKTLRAAGRYRDRHHHPRGHPRRPDPEAPHHGIQLRHHPQVAPRVNAGVKPDRGGAVEKVLVS